MPCGALLADPARRGSLDAGAPRGWRNVRAKMAASSVAVWEDLGQGRYLRVCPDGLRDELIAAMQLCLGCGDLPLARVNHMRREYIRASLGAADAAPGDAAAQRKAGMQKLAVALSPNFKDVLRARVLSSGAPYRSFLILYRRLLIERVLPHLAALTRENSFAVQREPSLRFALPGATALGARKLDDAELVGMHTDADYGHRPSELNFAFALTRFEGSASLFVESTPMRGDFTEVKMGAGDIYTFAGATCRHHNKRNLTDDARVSFDFRIVPMSMCDPLLWRGFVARARLLLLWRRYDASLDGERKSTREHRFTLGEYFERFDVDVVVDAAS